MKRRAERSPQPSEKPLSDGHNSVRLLLTGGARLVNDALANALCQNPALRLVGTEREPKEVQAAIASRLPDVVLIDVSQDKQASMRLTRLLSREFPEVSLLVIGVEDDQDIIGFVEAGARGYARRGASIAELTRRIDCVYHKQSLCSPTIANWLFSRLSDLSKRFPELPTNGNPELTPREAEVLGLLAEGLQNKEIARRLRVSLSTVKNHVHHVLVKFEAKNRRDATAYALRHGMLQRPRPSSASRD